MNKKIIQFTVIALVVTAVVLFIWFFNLQEYLSLEKIRSLIENAGIIGPIVFMLIYYAATIFFLSTVFLSVISGLLFGPVGIVYVVIAATLASQTAFGLSRWLGGNLLHKFGTTEEGVIKKLMSFIRRQLTQGGFRAFFIMRCLLLPYIPLSYAAGLIKEAKPKDIFWATLVANSILSPAFVLVGDSLLKGPTKLILPVSLIILVFLLPKIIRKIRSVSSG